VLGEEHPDTLMSASNLATSLANQGKYAEADELLQAMLAVSRRVLGPSHPTTLSAAESLDNVQSVMRSGRPTDLSRTKRGSKAAARPSERVVTRALSPTALVEAEARARAAEAELLAMLDVEDEGAGGASGQAKGPTKGKAKGHGGKR
jgi:hypothetical protein